MPGGVHENMKAWEPDEDRMILEMLDLLGPKWSKIVQKLPGRSISSVRNRWQRIEKGRKLREAGESLKNRCQQCGQPKRGHVCMAKLKNRGESGDEARAASLAWEEAQNYGGMEEEQPPPALVKAVSSNAMRPYIVEVCPPAPGEEVITTEPPLLSHMRSGTRICGELGFEALAAAAEQMNQRGDADAPMLQVISVESANHEATMKVPPLGRLPSLPPSVSMSELPDSSAVMKQEMALFASASSPASSTKVSMFWPKNEAGYAACGIIRVATPSDLDEKDDTGSEDEDEDENGFQCSEVQAGKGEGGTSHRRVENDCLAPLSGCLPMEPRPFRNQSFDMNESSGSSTTSSPEETVC